MGNPRALFTAFIAKNSKKRTWLLLLKVRAVIWKLFIKFVSNINLLTMEKLNRIKGALADAGKTNIWLAEQIGRDPVTVSKWCTNTSQPDLQTLAKISDLLNVDIRELLIRRK